eukprot:scaffold147209_cov26-Tisochrysis_lutea.AAC.3
MQMCVRGPASLRLWPRLCEAWCLSELRAWDHGGVYMDICNLRPQTTPPTPCMRARWQHANNAHLQYSSTIARRTLWTGRALEA